MTRSTRARTALVLVASLFALSGCSLAQLGTSPRPNAIPTVVAPTPAPTPGPTAQPKAEPRKTSQPIVLRAKAIAPFGTLVVDVPGPHPLPLRP